MSDDCTDCEDCTTCTPPDENLFVIAFEASGAVGKGDGPDALEVPKQPGDEL